MIDLSIFTRLSEMVVTAKGRQTAEHTAFLEFFRKLVETVPTEAVEAFGNMGGVEVISKGAKHSFGIVLTVADYLWWKKHIDQEGTRFATKPTSVQLDMLQRLSSKAEMERLEPAERKALLTLMDEALVK